jgi:DnaK suppressor protein
MPSKGTTSKKAKAKKPEVNKYAEIRKIVVKKKKEAELLLVSYRKQLKSGQSMNFAPCHQASEVDSGDNLDKLINRVTWQINRYTEVMVSIDNGTYGPCLICSEEIPFKRLKAYPLTLKCIECAEFSEKCNNR